MGKSYWEGSVLKKKKKDAKDMKKKKRKIRKSGTRCGKREK